MPAPSTPARRTPLLYPTTALVLMTVGSLITASAHAASGEEGARAGLRVTLQIQTTCDLHSDAASGGARCSHDQPMQVRTPQSAPDAGNSALLPPAQEGEDGAARAITITF